jgi:nucleoside-diphosphate-sugar epimerase
VTVGLTGATGFIGTYLVARLAADGHRVAALVRPSTDASTLDARGVRVIRGDVRDPAATRRAFEGGDVVIHLARAKGHPHRWGSEEQSTNVDGTAALVRGARDAGVPRVVVCSSSQVYPHQVRDAWITEDTPCAPPSPYGRSKVLAEQAAWRERGHAAVVIARITAVMGPEAAGWRGIFRSIAARRLRTSGDGANWIHPVDALDVVDGLIRCATAPAASGVYNLAGPEPIRMRDLVALAAEVQGVSGLQPAPLPAFATRLYLAASRVTDRVAGLRLPRVDPIAFFSADRRFDLTRAREDLGYLPRISVRDAISRALHVRVPGLAE